MGYADFRHRLPLRVRWAEVDKQGVVFNAHYLLYCDVCVTEYWRAIDVQYPDDFVQQGSDLFVRKSTIEYFCSLPTTTTSWSLRPHCSSGYQQHDFCARDVPAPAV